MCNRVIRLRQYFKVCLFILYNIESIVNLFTTVHTYNMIVVYPLPPARRLRRRTPHAPPPPSTVLPLRYPATGAGCIRVSSSRLEVCVSPLRFRFRCLRDQDCDTVFSKEKGINAAVIPDNFLPPS